VSVPEKYVPDKPRHFTTQTLFTPTSKTIRFRAAGMQEKLNKTIRFRAAGTQEKLNKNHSFQGRWHARKTEQKPFVSGPLACKKN